MRRLRLLSVLLLLLMALLASRVALAQENSGKGTLDGVVVDSMGAPVPTTIVWIHEQAGKASFSARPDRVGRFSIQLPEGYYHVLVSSAGFAPFCKSIWIRPGKQINLKVRLEPDREIAVTD